MKQDEVETIIRNAVGRMTDDVIPSKGKSLYDMSTNLPYEYDSEKRNKKLNEAENLRQVNEFIINHKKDYVFPEERVTEQPIKEDLFRKNIANKYQGLLDKIRKEEHINRKNKKYSKFRDDLQTMQLIREA